MTDEGLQEYLNSIRAYLSTYCQELDDLNLILQTRETTQHEYRSAERLLQLITEISIGLVKHWVKSIHKSAPSSAYQNFHLLLKSHKITQVQYERWQKIIGMRNALVHDYLNIDETLILDIVKNKKYLFILEFSEQAIQALWQKTTD